MKHIIAILVTVTSLNLTLSAQTEDGARERPNRDNLLVDSQVLSAPEVATEGREGGGQRRIGKRKRRQQPRLTVRIILLTYLEPKDSST